MVAIHTCCHRVAVIRAGLWSICRLTASNHNDNPARMFDIRPVGYVIGLLVAALGAAMLLPLGLDLLMQNGHWPVFLESALVTILSGGLVALGTARQLHAPKPAASTSTV